MPVVHTKNHMELVCDSYEASCLFSMANDSNERRFLVAQSRVVTLNGEKSLQPQ